MKRNFKRIKWREVFSAVLVCTLLIGSVAGLGMIFNKDTKSISALSFSVGGMDDSGNYTDVKTSIYTKDMFECQGLTIEPDFEASGSYQVFYYSENKNFIGSTDKMTVEDGAYTKGDDFALAKYARIVITPDVPEDEKDFKIRFYEVATYASAYTITVDNKQNFKAPNLFVYDETKVGKIGKPDPTTKKLIEAESAQGNNYVLISVVGIDSLDFVFEGPAENYTYGFYDANDTEISSKEFTKGLYEETIEIPDNAVTMCVIYHPSNAPAIYANV